MANPQAINELIDLPVVNKQVDELERRLVGLQDSFAKTTASVIPLNNAIAQSKTFKEFEANSNKAAIAVQKLAQEEAKSQLLQEKLIQTRAKAAAAYDAQVQKQLALEDKLIAKENARIAAMDKKGKSIVSNSKAEIAAYEASKNGSAKVTSTLNAQTIAENKAAIGLSAIGSAGANAGKTTEKAFIASDRGIKLAAASIEKLKIKLLEYKALAETSTSPKSLAAYNLQIQQTEKQISQLSNVGKVGFDNLGNAVKNSGNFAQKAYNSLRFLAYLLPGIGIAGILAFAVGPIIDYVSQLDIFKKKIDEIKKTREALNSISVKGAQDAQAEVQTLKQLYLASQNANLSLADRTKAVNELQKQYPSYFGNLKDEAILAGKGSEAYNKLTESIIKNATARAGVDLIVENSKQIIENEQKITDLKSEQNSIQASVNKQLAFAKDASSVSAQAAATQSNFANATAKKGVDIAKEIVKLTNENLNLNLRNLSIQEKVQKLGVDAIIPKPDPKPKPKKDTTLKDEQALLREQLEQAKLTAREIVDNDQNSLDARLAALVDYQKSSTELIKLDRDSKLKEEGLTADKRAAIKLAAENAIKKIDNDGAKEKRAIEKKAENDLRDRFKEGLRLIRENGKDVADLESINSEKRIAQIEKDRQQALEGLAQQFEKGLISEKKYNADRLLIEQQSSKDILNEQLKSINDIIKIKQNAELDTTSDQKKSADIQAKIDTDLSNIKIKNAEEVAARRKEIQAKEKELAQEIFNLGVSLVNGVFQSQSDTLKQQGELSDKRKEKEIEEVNSSILSQEEKANKIAIIEAQAQDRKEILERRQRLLDIQRAKFERAASIARIIGNTATGITSALASLPPNIPLSILIGAIGAAQIGQLLATPIPKFEKGGKMKKDGLAMFGEVGTELRIDPSGKASFTPDKPTIGMVRAGTEFISHKELINMIAKPEQVAYAGGQAIDIKSLIKSQEETSNSIKKAIMNQRQGDTVITKGAVDQMYRSAKKRSEYLKRNI